MATSSQNHPLPGHPQDTSGTLDVQMSFLAECINQVVNCTDVEVLSHRVVTLLHKVGYDRVQLFHYDPVADVLLPAARYGEATAEPGSKPYQPSIGDSLVETVAATGISRLCSDVSLARIRQLPLTCAGTGGELAIPIKLEKVGSSFQALALQRFIAAGVDGFAVLPMNPEDILPLMQAARDKRMAVVWYDREDLAVESRMAMVTADNHTLGYILGRQAGLWATTHVPAGKTLQVGVLSYRVMASVIKREHGILEGLNAAFGNPIEVVGIENGVDAAESLPIAEQWLKTFPELHMILAINDSGALGAYQAVIAAGRNNPETFFVGGIDATDDALTAIKQGGVYQATVDQSTREKGVAVVQTLVAALTGQSYQPLHIVPCTLVTPANVDMFLANKGAETSFDQILGDASLSARAGSPMTLGLNVFSLRNSYFTQVVEGARVAAARFGVELIVSESTQMLGVLDVQSDQAGALQDEDQRMLEIVSDLIATTLDKLRIETERARQKYILDTFMANVPDSIYFKDRNSRITQANLAHARSMGFRDPVEEIGKTDFDFFSEEYARPKYEQEQEIMRTGQSLLALEEPSAQGRWSLTIKMPLRDECGEIIGTFGISRDITPLKQAQVELATAKEKADAANRAKSTFLANMSHELRTPLNAVLGFSQLMKRDPQVTADQMEKLNIITHSGEYLLNLINNVLDLSKIEAGRVTLNETTLDLHQLQHELSSLMHVHAEEKGLRFTVEQSQDVPSQIVVDAIKLRQALINLIGNAIKYTSRGEIILRVSVATWESAQRARVRFKVVDTGPGIGEQDQARIFAPFVQLANQPTGQAGTGLGLAICKQYVELMGGQIGVTSELGKGSVFHVEIPVSILSTSEHRIEQRRSRVLGLAEGQPCYRLLIAEDQTENRLLLRQILQPFGFEVREAVNGQEAVTLFEQWQPHLIWMDIRMPVMDGLEATRRIKASAAGAHTKIIVLTAHALEDEQREILASGCDDVVRKPYRDYEILEILEKHLGVRFQRESEPSPSAAAPTSQLNAERLSQLPRPLLQELQQVTELLNSQRCLEVIDRIGEIDRELAEQLRCMIENLHYKELLAIIDNMLE